MLTVKYYEKRPQFEAQWTDFHSLKIYIYVIPIDKEQIRHYLITSTYLGGSKMTTWFGELIVYFPKSQMILFIIYFIIYL